MTELKMELADWLDDLCVRFIINLPQEELESVERICFQVEEAQWFYEDFIRPLDPSLPSLNLRDFCLLIFKHCPLLSVFSSDLHAAAFSEFLAYKTRVPVRGAIMLNEAMDKVVLVKGWKKNANWSFPRGKINKDENDLDCAVREVYEETGYDIRAAGLVKDESQTQYIEVTMREQHMRLYIFRGVPEDTHFEPRTRKEISKIQWYKLSDLPAFKKSGKRQEGYGDDMEKAKKFYMVAPFLVPLKKWIAQQRKNDAKRISTGSNLATAVAVEDRVDEEEPSIDGGRFEMETVGEQQTVEDFDKLLANLRASHGSAEPPVSEKAAEPKSAVNTAMELKRLLNVGTPAAPAAPAAVDTTGDVSKSSALLAILHGRPGNVLVSAPGHGALPPRTPAEQIGQLPLEPPTPQYHHQRPLPTLDLPTPPSFRLSPHSPGRLQQPNPSLAYQLSHPHLHHNGFHSHPPLPPGFDNQLPVHLRQQFLTTNYPGPHLPIRYVQPHLHPSRPYQQTADPHSIQTRRFPNAHRPVVPPASDLPPPKLTDHTLNLLNAFKSNGTPVASRTGTQSVTQSGAMSQNAPGMAVEERPDSSNRTKPTNPAGAAASETQDVSQLPVYHETYRQTATTGTLGKRHVINVSKSTRSATLNAPIENHQDPGVADTPTQQELMRSNPSTKRASSLLFRPSSIAPSLRVSKQTHGGSKSVREGQIARLETRTSPPPATKVENSSLDRESAALLGMPDASAAVNRGGTSKLIIAPAQMGKRKISQVASVSDMHSSRSPRDERHEPPISAPLSGPVRDKRVEPVARKGQSEMDDAAAPFNLESHKPSPRPITILARPVQLKSQTPPMLAPAVASRPPPAAPRQRKEFKPQILRRPTPNGFDSATAYSTLNGGTSDRRKSLPIEQSQDLLSLFAKPASAVPPGDSSPALNTPIASRTTGEALLVEAETLQRSRLSSIASAISNVTATDMQRSKSGISVSDRDRSFLLGYLQEAVRSSR